MPGEMLPLDVGNVTVLLTKDMDVELEPSTILVDVFGNSPETRLLDFFLDHPINDHMQSELAERTGMNKRTIKRVTELMLDNELITITRRIGKAILYRLNHESEIVKDIRRLESNISNLQAPKASE